MTWCFTLTHITKFISLYAMIFSNAYVIVTEENALWYGVLIEIPTLISIIIILFPTFSPHKGEWGYIHPYKNYFHTKSELLRGLQNFLLRNFDISASACSLIYA